MTTHTPSVLSRTVEPDDRKDVFNTFAPMSDKARADAIRRAESGRMTEYLELIELALDAGLHAPVRKHVLEVVRDTVVRVDRHRLMEVDDRIPAWVAYMITRGLDAKAVQALADPELQSAAKQVFEQYEDKIVLDRVSVVVFEEGYTPESKLVEEATASVQKQKIPIGTDAARKAISEFLGGPHGMAGAAGGKGPTTRSGGTVSLSARALVRELDSTSARREVVTDFKPLRGAVRQRIIKETSEERDPMVVRARALAAALPEFRRRELVRAANSAISVSGGQSHLASYPALADALVYESLKDERDLEAFDRRHLVDRVRADAESLFRQSEVELYEHRVNDVLERTGTRISKPKLAALAERMREKNIPLPTVQARGASR